VVAVLALAWPGFAVRGAERTSDWPTERWATSTPEEQGMDPGRLEAMKAYIHERDIPIDSAIVVRHGRIVFEMYGPGYSASKRHQLQSVTKSVTSMLVGIALDRGAIGGLDETIGELLPDYTTANPDPRRDRITLEHLLTMSDGIDWHEHTFPYEDPRNQWNRMSSSSDAVQYVLDRPMEHEPGEVWAYNSGASVLLGEAIEEATGRDLLVFARDTLFDPLGIGPVYWERTASGHYQSGGGLSMAPRDMARLGYLMLHNGTWDGQQILSAEWVARSTVVRYTVFAPIGYGYQWWILPDGIGYRAQGLYEQYIYVLPGLDMVIVFTADIRDGGLYRVDGLVNTFILPACSDYVAPAARSNYDAHGFTFQYPAQYLLEEAPLPGHSAVSDESGMVQITSNTEPLELVVVLWNEVEEGEDVPTILEAYLEGFATMVGELAPGESREGQKDGHAMALRFSHVALEGSTIPMVTGVWICDASGLGYAVTYLTAEEKTPEELRAGLPHRLEELNATRRETRCWLIGAKPPAAALCGGETNVPG
jgi:CubicO group peptidase (beta-lactamase class C family)